MAKCRVQIMITSSSNITLPKEIRKFLKIKSHQACESESGDQALRLDPKCVIILCKFDGVELDKISRSFLNNISF